MKGFATSLTASRLEEMLAFYIVPNAGSRDEADDSRGEGGAVSAKTADRTPERMTPHKVLAEH